MLQPRRKTRKERYGGVSQRTMERWEADPELGFPQPVIIRGRKFDCVEALDRWDVKMAARGRATRTPPAAGKSRHASRASSPNMKAAGAGSS